MNMHGRSVPFLGNGTLIRCACSDGRDVDLLEDLIRGDYERARPGDTLEDLKCRARFSKEDRGLLIQWMGVAEERSGAAGRRERRAAAA